MIMTTPNEFLQFAKEMGLGRIKSTSSSLSSSPLSRSISNNDGYTSTGLAVLNNLCRLIEQIHQLKAENHRLRAHLDLVEHVDKFQQHLLMKDDHKQLMTSSSVPDEDKSHVFSQSTSLKMKRSLSNRERKGRSFRHPQDDSSFILPIDHEPNELIEHNSNSPTIATWSKVRHALKFSLRRKHDPPLLHTERQPIPAISISIESDDEQQSQDNKYLKTKKKKKIISINDNRQTLIGEETDQDDESTQFIRTYHKGKLDSNETINSSSIDRQETPISINSISNSSNIDDENLLTRKQSKIARYRRKIRSKLDTVKRQFSDQNQTSSIRRPLNLYATTFDEIGTGLNHALLTQQLAPALTKSYQQKMREWETMQKSHFLVTYRRQSIIPKMDLNSNSRKASISLETSPDQTISSSPMVDELNLELEKPIAILGPLLSPNQRSLIVHQWREIMSEEISLRHYNEYLQQKMNSLKQLETDLKSLKTNIFCTNQLIKPQSMINIHQINLSSSSFSQRCRSLDSFISMPASWSLAVQSAAYSDVLDGTSTKTTERAILFNKNFFDRLEHFKHDRLKFEQDLQLLNPLKIEPKTFSLRNKRGPIRGCLRKLLLISSSEFPQHFLPDPIIPLQTIIPDVSLSSNNELLSKSSKHSRFDLKKSFQRSRSMYLTQFHSWLQRRRQQYSPIPRRKSAAESKASPPKLLGSPRLARLHQKFFKTSAPPSPQMARNEIPIQILDDSDNRSQYELPVRIYFPPFTSPITRRVRIDENHMATFDNDQEDPPTPIFDRKHPLFKPSTAKERRESFATLSNVFHNRYL